MKIHIITLLVGLSFFSACTKSSLELEKEIQNFELEHDLADTNMRMAYCDKLVDFVHKFPDHPNASMYANMAAINLFLIKDYNKSLEISRLHLNNYPKSSEVGSTCSNMAQIFAKGLNKPDSAIKYFLLSNEKRPLSVLDKTELAYCYENLAKSTQDKKEATELYNKASQLNHNTGAYQASIDNLIAIIALDSTDSKVPNLMQQIAFTYENQILDNEKATYYYSQLANKFPNTEAGKQSTFLLKNNLIGKSAEEILAFNAKNNK